VTDITNTTKPKMAVELLWETMQSTAVKGTSFLDSQVWPQVYDYTGLNGTVADEYRIPYGDGNYDIKTMTMLAYCPASSIGLICGCVFFGIIRNLGLFKQYRIQDKYPPTKLLMKAYIEIGIDQLISQWLIVYYIFSYFVIRTEMVDSLASPELPSLSTHLLHIFGCICIDDTLFYWAHRLFHSKMLYKYHKQHHGFTVNDPITSKYAHVLEVAFSNALPTVLGCFVFKLHATTTAIWLLIRVLETADAHSGYDLPFSVFTWLRDGRKHDYHHSHGGGPEGVCVGGVYGSWFPFWDWVCGTDKTFKAYRKKQIAQGKKKRN